MSFASNVPIRNPTTAATTSDVSGSLDVASFGSWVQAIAATGGPSTSIIVSASAISTTGADQFLIEWGTGGAGVEVSRGQMRLAFGTTAQIIGSQTATFPFEAPTGTRLSVKITRSTGSGPATIYMTVTAMRSA